MEKIYKEPKTNYLFTFNSEELKRSCYAFILKQNKEGGKRFTREELYNKLSKKLFVSPEAVRKHISGSNAPNDIKVIYAYGEFLEDGNKYAFLSLCETENTFNEKAQDILAYDDFAEKCVKAVYSELIKIISEFSASECFNKVPDNSDALLYYRRKIDKAEAMINQIHGHNELVSRMLSVTFALKRMICTHDFPGVPAFWYLINPNLRFYSISFDIMINSPEFYELIKSEDCPISLDYYPDSSEMELFYEYFAKLYKESEDNNFHYNSNDFFQQELIKTIKIIFETEIQKLLEQ